MRKILILFVACVFSLSVSAQQKTMKAYMVADAHLDTQWNWDVQATIRDHIRNTLTQNLFLLKKYPNYIFNFEGAVKYAWMKEYYPLQYEEMKRYIAMCSLDRHSIEMSSEQRVPIFSCPTVSVLDIRCQRWQTIAD